MKYYETAALKRLRHNAAQTFLSNKNDPVRNVQGRDLSM